MWSTSVVGDARLTLSLEIVMRALLVSLVTTLAVLSPAAVAADPAPGGQALPQVIGGQAADPGEDPWMAALVIDQRYVSNPFAGLICGASFISPDTLVTAAHCVLDFFPGELDIVAGSNNLVPAETERLEIRNIRVHPEHTWRSDLFDVAVIQLRHPPTTFTPTPIDLVGPDDADLWEVGDEARFTGWGVDERGQPISSLMEAEDPIISDPDCRARYTGQFFQGRTMVCVGEVGPGGGSSSPCYGDSGGPLTVSDAGRPVLIGLVLGGFRCGDPNYPAIFTQVSAAVDFLAPYLDPDSAPRRVRNLHAGRRGPEGRAVLATWNAPVFDGGTRILRYDVEASWHTPNGGAAGVAFDIGGNARRVRIPQLPANARIQVSVTPRNAIGEGPTATVTVPA
jgi:secreted trypsin-like serine protease